MIRTQIYLPEEIHTDLLRIAQEKGTTLSRLIRQGAKEVIKKTYGKLSPKEKALKFFANPPKKYQIKLSKPAHILIREERD